ncbi:SCP-like extracellular, partial [Neoconidiobolus thromboides FSU 785]
SPLDYNYMLQKVNQVRAQNGASPLKYNNLLNVAAQQHSDDQARAKKMSHTGSDGSSPDERVEKAGYKWASVAENVAWNQKTVDQVMDAWVKSPGHFKNLVNKKYTDFGAGVNNYYWTQTFGSTS